MRRVHYPGLPGHPGHLLAGKQMRGGFGGVLSVEVHGGPDAAGRVCERTEVFTLAVSLGSVESLIEQPARMTHCTTAGTPVSVSDSLLRLSVGLEDCGELIADLGQALAGLREAWMTALEDAAGSYRRLLRVPVLRGLAVADVCARLPQGMVTITLLLVAATHASMTTAGLVVTGYTIGQAVTGPVRGRLADRRGLVLVCAACGGVYAVALLCLLAGSLARGPAWLLVATAALAGLSVPPLARGCAACGRLMRAAWCGRPRSRSMPPCSTWPTSPGRSWPARSRPASPRPPLSACCSR